MESGRARFSSLLPAGAAGEVRRKHRVKNHLSNSSFSEEAAVPEEETAGFPRVESTAAISVHRRSASTSKLKMTTRKRITVGETTDDIKDGTIEGDRIAFKAGTSSAVYQYSGTRDGDQIMMTRTSPASGGRGGQSIQFVLKRS